MGTPYVFRIEAVEEEAEPSLENVVNFLKDLVLLHDRLTLLDPEFGYKYHLSPVFYRRFGRRLKDENMLKVRSLSRGSPLIVEVSVGLSLLIGAGVAVYTWLKVLNQTVEWQVKRKERETKELEREIKREEVRKSVAEREIAELVSSL